MGNLIDFWHIGTGTTGKITQYLMFGTVSNPRRMYSLYGREIFKLIFFVY